MKNDSPIAPDRSKSGPILARPVLPIMAAGVAILALLAWLDQKPSHEVVLREPGADHAGDRSNGPYENPVFQGHLTTSTEAVPDLTGSWPQFRGEARDGAWSGDLKLARVWGPSGPPRLWSVEVGEGYAGPSISSGRVYLMDYDRARQEDALRCLSLMTGREIWRFAYPIPIKRNHGMSRTVPAISDNRVVAIGPKCHVLCCDAGSGQLKWGIDLVHEEGATVPPWYTGQCPLIDAGRVILAPGGPKALLMAVQTSSGEVSWRSSNPMAWKMTHSSVMRMEVEGVAQYVYCASGGVVGVAADDGRLLWTTTDWKIGIATVPSPLPLPEGRLFLAGGYNAGSAMLRVRRQGGQWLVETEFRNGPDVFGATQHTPVFHGDRIYGVRPEGDLVSLDLKGRVVWSSEPMRFGLGPFLLANDLIFALTEGGQLTLLHAGGSECQILAHAQVLDGREAWAPMALADGKLLVRDLKQMVCLEVGGAE